MLAVCAAGRILNPKAARSQMIGAMTMGVGAALMEELAVDKRFGFFVNHDLAGYEVPVHADIPHQEVIFLDEVDPISSPMKAKGVGELGLCGVGAAIANAIYNATGVRVRDYPITLDKHLDRLPAITWKGARSSASSFAAVIGCLPLYMRMSRAETLSVRRMLYIDAARGLEAERRRPRRMLHGICGDRSARNERLRNWSSSSLTAS